MAENGQTTLRHILESPYPTASEVRDYLYHYFPVPINLMRGMDPNTLLTLSSILHFHLDNSSSLLPLPMKRTFL